MDAWWCPLFIFTTARAASACPLRRATCQGEQRTRGCSPGSCKVQTVHTIKCPPFIGASARAASTCPRVTLTRGLACQTRGASAESTNALVRMQRALLVRVSRIPLVKVKTGHPDANKALLNMKGGNSTVHPCKCTGCLNTSTFRFDMWAGLPDHART